MSETLKRMGSKIVLGLLGAGALIGWKFYQRGQSADETKTEVMQLCEADENCKAVVAKHFDNCHEQAYRMGGRRNAGGLDTDAFTRCINHAAGEEIFSTH
ncbi:MAG TPA: hypothetical protein VFZ61_13140 [Polyangiales bacterium]